MDAQAEANGLAQLQRTQELERSRRRIAAAIEKGEALQFKSGQLEVPTREFVRPAEIGRKQDKDSGQEPELSR